jgi:hypothetical protein
MMVHCLLGLSYNFENKEFTSQEKEQYNKLISGIKKDLLLILDTIKHRDYFTNMMTRIYAETGKEMKAALKEQEYQNRVLTITLLVTVKCCKTNSTFLYV